MFLYVTVNKAFTCSFDHCCCQCETSLHLKRQFTPKYIFFKKNAHFPLLPVTCSLLIHIVLVRTAECCRYQP